MGFVDLHEARLNWTAAGCICTSAGRFSREEIARISFRPILSYWHTSGQSRRLARW